MKRILIGILILLILGIIILKVLSNSYNDIETRENGTENETSYDVIDSQDEDGNVIKKYVYLMK